MNIYVVVTFCIYENKSEYKAFEDFNDAQIFIEKSNLNGYRVSGIKQIELQKSKND